MDNIAKAISDSIKEGKWLAITYENVNEKRVTNFWCAIKDIEPISKTLIVDMYNSSKSFDAIEDTRLRFERIKSAQVIRYTTYDTPGSLIDKLNTSSAGFTWLHYENFNNNILMYLNECNQLDTDPYQKKYAMVDGVDLNSFAENGRVLLNDQQISQVVSSIYYNDLRRLDSQSNEMALSVLSIDNGDRKFVVAYRTVCFNPSEKCLTLVGHLHFNFSFMIDGKPHSLSSYIDMSVEEFEESFLANQNETIELLRENLHGAEKINTRPDFMILERDTPVNLSNLYELIEQEREEGCLSVPVRAFFGDISRRNDGRKEPAIVIYDKKINIDQMLVLYNAMKNPVTYVQGPPGTGKTQTLFNVIVSAYFNQRTVLVCTMNNKPVNGIVKKLDFQYHDNEIPFPYLRLGNKQDVAKATLRIRSFLKLEYPGKPNLPLMDRIKQEESQKNEKLVGLLKMYEERKTIEDNLECAKKVMAKCGGKAPGLQQEMDKLVASLAGHREVTNEEVTNLFSCAKDNPRYQQYIFYSSVYHLGYLQLPTYSELREIVMIEDEEERVSKFNAWTAQDENMKLLTEAFPLIFTTNISASRLGTGGFTFDMTIMDEAGQCDMAKALIPIARGNSLLLVGDEDQLQPVIVLDKAINKKLREKYQISDNYDYTEQSILTAMKGADNISKRVTLRYHYRCGRKIVSFSNQYFYGKSLKLQFANGEGEVHLESVHNTQNRGRRNECPDEAMAIVDYVSRNKTNDAVIITPFLNQQYLINDLLAAKGIKDVKACTIHTVQGAEASTVILSSAVSQRTSARTFEWLANHKEIANVAVTRAQDKLIVFADDEAIKKMTGTGDNVWNELIRYAHENGNVEVVPPQPKIAEIGLSNGSRNEAEFYKTMAQLCSTMKNYKIKRNVAVKDVFPDDDTLTDSKMEFDSVVYSEKSLFHKEKPLIAFEVSGGEHFGDSVRERYDTRKRNLCKEKGITLITISNDFVKDYEYMRELVRKTNHEEYEQSFFDFGDLSSTDASK